MTPAEFRAARKQLALTQGQLSSVMGLRGPASISEYEAGKRLPGGQVTRLLRAYLDGYRPVDWPDPDAGWTQPPRAR